MLYDNESIVQVLFVTLVLGGGCALLAGRAIALTWRSMTIAAVAMLPMGLAVRFAHFALFNEPLLQPLTYVVETLILIVLASPATVVAPAASDVNMPWCMKFAAVPPPVARSVSNHSRYQETFVLAVVLSVIA